MTTNLLISLLTMTNIWQVTTEIHANIYVALHVNCPLLLSDRNQNWNMLTKI